ncbi:MAG: baseplate J/gp47 family protein, partial [Magnetococcus sp. YQC-3]
VSFFVNGPSQSINTTVVNSLSCNNVTAAIGGANFPTMEEVRNLVAFNFSAQKRAVTVSDYDSLIRTMPSQFGAPAKVAITEENNKIKIQMLAYDESGALTEIVSNTLKNNVANYLSNYRMINDYISIESANVIDLGINIDVVLDNSQTQGVVISQIVNLVSAYFDPTNRQMGQNVNISNLRRDIQNQNGVISISDIKVFNKVGGQYSSSQTSQRYIDDTTKEIELIDDTIFAEPNQTYQIRYANKDINVRVKNLTTVNFS